MGSRAEEESESGQGDEGAAEDPGLRSVGEEPIVHGDRPF
jgi:hypothetical protein